MTHPITVLLVDDHALVLGALSGWLRGTPDIQVVGEAPNAEIAITEALRLRPDLVVMDVDMPGLLCFDAARTIRARLPETRIVFLSAFFHDRYIQQALDAEASAYLTKGEPPAMVADAIRAVARGGTYFSPEVAERLVIDEAGVSLTTGTGATRGAALAQREIEVLRYVAQGLSKKEIAGTMHLSVKTVDNHCTSLMSKLAIHDRVELARYAIREGLAEA